MIRSIVVTRTELGLGNLELWQPGKYVVPDGTFGGGQTTQRRVTSTSPLVKGRYASSIVEDQRVASLAVHVIAANEAGMNAPSMDLIYALTQFRYTLVWYWNGLSGTWQCEAADWAAGSSGVLDSWSAACHNELFFTIPHRRISGV